MKLNNLADNNFTDKNYGHSYAEVYEALFEDIKDTAENILEIGINKGGSIDLWQKYFTNANVYGVDCLPIDNIDHEILQRLLCNNKVNLLASTDAYNVDTLIPFYKNDTKFDVVIDDGPHTLKSQIEFIDLYTPLLTDNGILIIEDVQDIKDINNLIEAVPDNLKQYIQVYDLRDAINRYDDILFIINKYAKVPQLNVYNGKISSYNIGKWVKI
jgi:hypothetical protein